MSLRLSANESNREQVLAHLRAADAQFVPPLSQRVDLAAYATKLCTHAERDEAWQDGALVGLVATYCNDRDQGAYISNVSVLPALRGQGLGDALVRQALARARERRFPRVGLHLHPDNRAAFALYRRHGFVPGAVEGEQLTMTLTLDRP